MVVVVIGVDEKEWVLMSRVEGVIVLGDERLGFEEVFPCFANTLEADDGFDGKVEENEGD